MIPSHHWARNFVIEQRDIEHLTGLLLEKETPLNSEDLARALIQERLSQEAATLRDRYKDARFYNPAQQYEVNQRLVFPELDYETGVVKAIRPGNNPDYGVFNVIAIEFDDDELNNPGKDREFAAELTVPHELSDEDTDSDSVMGMADLTVEDVLSTAGDDIINELEASLRESD
jgi:hypothetical protein